MIDEQQAVALVKVLHAVRESASEARRADNGEKGEVSGPLREFLLTLPEGERDVWDMEPDPPIGVALRDGGGMRWIDLTELDDATIVNLARRGGLALSATGYDAMLTLAPSDRSLAKLILQVRKAVHAGGGLQLVLLPERRTPRGLRTPNQRKAEARQ